MEAETALVGTDSAVELDAVAGVGLDLALIVNPGDAEGEDAVRLYQTLNDLCLLELRVLVLDLFDGLQYFLNSLQVLFLCGILGLKACHDVSCFHDRNQ